MAPVNEFLADGRRRNLAILAGAALTCVLLAAFALHREASETAPQYSSVVLLPELVPALNDTVRVHVESRKGTFDVVRIARDRWVIPQHGRFNASLDQIRQTLVGMAGLETIEPKTSRPDWFHYVDLDAPPKGNGTKIVVTDARGQELASLIFGKSEDIGDPGGAVGLFVRKPGENQSWLVRSVFEPKADASDWMDKSVIDIDRARIQETDVTPANGPPYAVRREKPSDPDFALTAVPRGREVANEAAPDAVAAALTGFAFDDARPASAFDFGHPTRLVTKTFDGLVVTTDVIQQGTDNWARISVQAAPGKAAGGEELSQINAKASGWAFKLPSFKGQQFMTSLESLLKPLASPAKSNP